MSKELGIGMLVAGIGILVGLMFLFVAVCYWRIQWRKMDKLLTISPDKIRSGDYCLDETLDGKIYQKLLDLYQHFTLEHRQAEEEKEAVKSYIADLSHQMKTPLANLSLYSELLLEEELTRQQRQLGEKFVSETQKMKWLIGNLTKIARLETGAIVFDTEENSLVKTVKRAVDAVYGQAVKKEITISCHDIPDIRICHNVKWTAEALENILENAVKYQTEHTSIEIWGEVLELYVRIYIKDQGPGIAKEDFYKIFRRFYRGSNVREEPGSGLGLYLSQLILNQQRGYILVQSELGEGSCFMVYLPLQGMNCCNKEA